MAKEDIFSKISFKDYNNMLENILEQKDFSEDVKNLLLSMLYKIENAYEDYKTVKVNVNSKKYFLLQIINIIKENCNEIQLVKSLSEESKILEDNNINYLVAKEEGKIISYENERSILEALIDLKQNKIELDKKYEIFSEGFKEILTIGNIMNTAEVIRDFNGWSWDITPTQIINKNINIIYQNLLILLGNNFLQKWITGKEIEEEEIEIPNNEILRSKYNSSFGLTREEVKENQFVDYIENMQEILVKKYGEENANNFMTQLIKVAIAVECNKSKKQKNIIIKKEKEIQEKLDQMQDNIKYIENLSNAKKNITIQIKQIDNILNDEKLLKEEYERRNAFLENKDKIFSVSHLKIMLEKERENAVKKIKEYNKQMEPKEFIKIKGELENQKQFFEDIGISKEERVDEEKQISNLQKYFLNCFKEKIEKAESKKELTDLVYELRYYEQLPYKNEAIFNEIKNKDLLGNIEEKLINKACTQKCLVMFSKEISLNKKILENQFKTKIINLENTVYILKYQKGILKVEIYDTNIEESIIEIPILKKVELEVRLNKKIKIWE